MTAPTAEKPQDDTENEDSGVGQPAPETAAQGQPGPVVKDDGTAVTSEDWAAVNEALRKARQEARAAKRGKPEQPAGDVDQAVREAATAAEAKFKPLVIKAHARSAFVEAGLVLSKDNPDAAMARAIRLLDMDDLDITDDGTVDGLREQVEEIRQLFPELFGAARKPAARVDGADKPGQTNAKPTSSADAIAGLLTRR